MTRKRSGSLVYVVSRARNLLLDVGARGRGDGRKGRGKGEVMLLHYVTALITASHSTLFVLDVWQKLKLRGGKAKDGNDEKNMSRAAVGLRRGVGQCMGLQVN